MILSFAKDEEREVVIVIAGNLMQSRQGAEDGVDVMPVIAVAPIPGAVMHGDKVPSWLHPLD